MVVRRDGEGRTGETDATADSRRSHLTTIVLEEHGDDSWRATQHGVPVESRGATAAAAAADCRAVGDGAVKDRTD